MQAKKNPSYAEGQVRERREAFLEETSTSPERNPLTGLFYVPDFVAVQYNDVCCEVKSRKNYKILLKQYHNGFASKIMTDASQIIHAAHRFRRLCDTVTTTEQNLGQPAVSLAARARYLRAHAAMG
jgi:predicted ATPase